MGLQVGGSHSSQSGSGSSMPVIPDEWSDAYKKFGTMLGDNGITNIQQPGVDALTNAVTNSGTSDYLKGLNTNYLQPLADRGALTLGGMEAKAAAGTPGYESYGALTPITAQTVNATQGSQYMKDYQNPYTNDVVNASLGDLKSAYDRNMVSSGMAAAAGGAFGGGRQAIREAQTADDYLRNVAGTSAGLRDQAFNTAAGYGMQDANRFLTADTTNAANKYNADTYNSNMKDSRQRFDLGSVYQNQNDRAGIVGQMANNSVNANNISQGNAGALINAGGMGVDQLLKNLTLGTSQFGSNTTSSGSGSNVGASAGGK